MRPDRLFLQDILDAADEIGAFLDGVDEAAFLADRKLQAAVLQKLTVIGEASARLSDATREWSPDVEWRTIIGLRNVVVHAYFALDWPQIWDTAVRDVPDLRRRITSIIRALETRESD